MISRFGQPIYVGWPEHHVLMIEAANTLDWKERRQAYRDIAELTGRNLKSVRDKANWIRAQAVRQAEAATRKRIMRLPKEWKMLPPSQLKQPSLQQLMAGRA